MNFYSVGGKGDTPYISRHDFISQLNQDLKQPNFDFSQLPTPKSQAEYQQLLQFIKQQIMPRL